MLTALIAASLPLLADQASANTGAMLEYFQIRVRHAGTANENLSDDRRESALTSQERGAC